MTPPGRGVAGGGSATRQSGRPQPQGRVLPGSWEGVLDQAREHAQNGNTKAVTLFEKVINGLARLPLERRRANDNRLQNYYLGAVIGLQSFYARRDRFEEAMAVVRDAIPHAENDDHTYLQQHLIGLQFMAGQNEAALQKLRAEAEAESQDATDWSPVVWGYIRCDRAHEALPLLDELAARYGVKQAAESQADSDATQQESVGANEEAEERAYNAAALDGLRGVVLVETGDFDAGIEAFQRAIDSTQSPYRDSIHLIYTRLTNTGRHEDALHFIQRDSGHPVRAGFWRGLVYHRQGRHEDAKAAWRAITEMGDEAVQRAPVEATLAQFYLGDPKGETLSNLLAAIREAEHTHWTLFMLAAVGFAARGDRDTAISDFRLAVGLLKSLSEGRKLPVNVWYMVKDLFKPEDVEFYAQFFEMPLPKSALQET